MGCARNYRRPTAGRKGRNDVETHYALCLAGDLYIFLIRLKKKYAPAYLNRGVTKAELGSTLEAKQDLQYALKLAIRCGDVGQKKRIEEYLHQAQ